MGGKKGKLSKSSYELFSDDSLDPSRRIEKAYPRRKQLVRKSDSNSINFQFDSKTIGKRGEKMLLKKNSNSIHDGYVEFETLNFNPETSDVCKNWMQNKSFIKNILNDEESYILSTQKDRPPKKNSQNQALWNYFGKYDAGQFPEADVSLTTILAESEKKGVGHLQKQEKNQNLDSQKTKERQVKPIKEPTNAKLKQANRISEVSNNSDLQIPSLFYSVSTAKTYQFDQMNLHNHNN